MNAPYPPPVYKPPQPGDDAVTDETQTSPQPHDLQWLADLLDSRWRIPGTSWRFGVDAIAGLVPGAGDLVAGLAGLYIISAAARAGAPVPSINFPFLISRSQSTLSSPRTIA